MLGISEKLNKFQKIKKPLSGYSRILLSTDGIYKMLSEEELETALKKPLKDVLNMLVRTAQIPDAKAEEYARERNMRKNEAQQIIGGSDNMTGILISRQED
jgi:serine/threonine protein phosphatase PrpC